MADHTLAVEHLSIAGAASSKLSVKLSLQKHASGPLRYQPLSNPIREAALDHRGDTELLEAVNPTALVCGRADQEAFKEILKVTRDQQMWLNKATDLTADIDAYAELRCGRVATEEELDGLYGAARRALDNFQATRCLIQQLRQRFIVWPTYQTIKKPSRSEWDFVWDHLALSTPYTSSEVASSDGHVPDFNNLGSTRLSAMDYHPEFVKLENGGFLIGRLPSRRVILSNLPPNTSLNQVLWGVRAYGGIVSASLLETGSITRTNTKSAMLEFVYPGSATEYVEFVTNKHSLLYSDEAGTTYKAIATLVTSNSNQHAPRDLQCLEAEQTRALVLLGFPPTTLWFFLNAVGFNHIVHVDYNVVGKTLTVEFTSLFHADRTMKWVEQGSFASYVPESKAFIRFATDSSQASVQSLVDPDDTVIPHVDLERFKSRWNSLNYNEHWPTEWSPVMQQQGLFPKAPPAERPRPTQKELLAQQLDLDIDEVDDYLDDRKTYQDTEYRILGSNITLTRRKWGWSILAADNTKLQMTFTMDDPAWADHWDQHFKANDEVNLRTWGRYGVLARHRLERAAKLRCAT